MNAKVKHLTVSVPPHISSAHLGYTGRVERGRAMGRHNDLRERMLGDGSQLRTPVGNSLDHPPV